MGGVSPVNFDGRDLYQPGYYGRRNISGLSVGSATGSRLLMLGECKGGIPFNATSDFPNAEDRINWVSNTDDLNKILRDGPAYYGALFALTPTSQPGVNGAPAVGVIRINKATKSTSTVKDVDTNNVLDLKSTGYGLFTTQIRRKISNGTTKGKKISVKFEDQTIEGDNITNELFSLQYIGAGSACSLTIDPVGNLVTAVTGGPGGENLSIDLTSFDTVANLVAAINANAVYSAVLLGDGAYKVSELDKVVIGDAVSIMTAYVVKGILKAVTDWFNNSSSYISAALSSGAVRRIPANDADYVFLTGGSEGGTPVQQDWQDALDQICARVDASLIGVMTANAAVHAAVSSHVSYMSSVDGRNERQACVGAADGDSKSTKLAATQAINNALVGYAGTELKRYDKVGQLLTWGGLYKAAEILGMASGNAITFAPTNKMINAVGVKELYSNTDKNDYIKGGVMVSAPSPLGGIRVVRSVTTYQGTNLIANEWSAMRTALFITKDHRTYVEGLIGEAGDNTILESIRNRALMRLDYYVEQGWLVNDPQYGNAFRNFTFNVVGDTVRITYEGTLVVPVNFILVTHNFTVIGVKK